MHNRFISPLCIREGFAYGWAVQPGTSRLKVQLWMDGRHIATEYTGTTLPGTCHSTCGKPPSGGSGFAFALPAAALDGFPHDLHAELWTETEDSLHGQVQTYQHSEVRGEVRQQGRQFVGTVWFDAQPSQPARLQIRNAAGRVVLRRPLAVSATREKHGFPAKFAVPCEKLPHEPLRFCCDGQSLRGSPISRHPNVIGIVEHVDENGIRGWAFDSADVGRPIELCLRVDGRPTAWFRPNMRRPEIEGRLAHHEVGLIGFQLALPEGIADGRRHRVEVVAADDGQPLKSGHHIVQMQPAWVDMDPSASAGVAPRRMPTHGPRAVAGGPPPLVSVVILTRNGAALLAAFLESWERHNLTIRSEIIVVDHASGDATLELLHGWRERLDIEVIALDRNDSFSASCNLGAARAKGDYVLFMNNDIVWLQDALPAMLETLQHEDVGIVGLKLLKSVGESEHALQPVTEVQHLGIRFKLDGNGYWPYEATPSPGRPEYEHAAQVMPAVTGAVLLCRKTDFEQVGGFDTEYFYGFEDVELCLRLSQRLGKLVVSRNDLCALHRHGHTRLSGRDLALFDRVQRNAQVLESQLGLWLKQAYWRSLVTGDGYMTTEALTVGIVVDSPAAGTRSALSRDALALARALKRHLPHARVVLLPPERRWKDAAGLHVLVVGTPTYDVRAIHNARADLLTLAWPRSNPDAWRSLAWWNEFGGYLLPHQRIPSESGEEHRGAHGARLAHLLLGRHRWRLRVAIQVPVPASELGTDTEMAQLARALRADLSAANVVCWLVPIDAADNLSRMRDICITLQGDRRAHQWPVRDDELNVLWLSAAAAKRPAGWSPRHARVTREQPRAPWLQQVMAKSIRATFEPAPSS